MVCIKYFQLSATVWGFHYYRNSWIPEPEHTLNCFHEEGNTFDRFAIKVCEKSKNEIVGHLPMEISHGTKYLLERGANVADKLKLQKIASGPRWNRDSMCCNSVHAWYYD